MLRLDWCSPSAARAACLRWHYSRSVPASKAVNVGVWEDGRFIGAIIYSWGSNRSLGAPYGLAMTECAELCRVAIGQHVAPVSRMLAISVRMLHRQSPGLKLLVSFADPVQGHHGGIYQANGWLFCGTSSPSFEWRLDGKRLNKRAFTGANFGKGAITVPDGAVKVATPGKLRYIKPLDRQTAADVASLARPYPKRVDAQATSMQGFGCPGSIGHDALVTPDERELLEADSRAPT